MQANAMLINHAKDAVERTGRSLASMRARFQTPGIPLGHQHRLLIDGALLDLSRRHESLIDLYNEMLSASAEQLPTCWQRFFACYDDYLEAVRDTRSRLIQDENEPSDQESDDSSNQFRVRAGEDGSNPPGKV